MIISLLFSNPILFFIICLSLVIAITIHEFAHAWAADKLGDPTPRYQGRVTLNPKAHLDPIGTVAILLIGFGWGKPVMFDPYNLKNPSRDTALIAAAGPASNLILATIIAILFQLGAFSLLPAAVTTTLVYSIISLNVMLLVFNLLPVFPLDGEKILTAFLPKLTALTFHNFMQQYGQFILLALLIPWSGSSPISKFISPIIDTLTRTLIGF